MERVCAIIVAVFIFQEALGFSIKNEQLGKCLQPQEARRGGRLTLEECRPDSAFQQWRWHPETQALSSVQTGECLSASRGQEHESVRLQGCRRGEAAREGQAWGCSKKGHLTLLGKGLHLSGHQDSAKVFLSKERSRASKWRTQSNSTVCGEPGGPHHWHHHGNKPSTLPPTPPSTPSAAASTDTRHQESFTVGAIMEGGLALPNPTEPGPEQELSPQPFSTVDPKEASMAFFSLEYGMGWKVTMLVLSSLALALGLVILLLNIYYNRRKKVVCMVKSYTPTGAASQPGSPVPNERAPLTQNAMRPPRSPSLQRGEILIEWKDGTVTPLFDNSSCLTD
ncbi:hypothetical protein MATL_G00065400 [Megalops atlanticus]|uniref:Ricin B lectin domain-containing protein n=1 Tax=Megalops atlanticus TaxID=7932 RepID=A0A9D3QA60_MEGAT|nr:hypothetical protein MATL_G00065400 [Megalops atlanticus]